MGTYSERLWGEVMILLGEVGAAVPTGGTSETPIVSSISPFGSKAAVFNKESRFSK